MSNVQLMNRSGCSQAKPLSTSPSADWSQRNPPALKAPRHNPYALVAHVEAVASHPTKLAHAKIRSNRAVSALPTVAR